MAKIATLTFPTLKEGVIRQSLLKLDGSGASLALWDNDNVNEKQKWKFEVEYEGDTPYENGIFKGQITDFTEPTVLQLEEVTVTPKEIRQQRQEIQATNNEFTSTQQLQSLELDPSSFPEDLKPKGFQKIPQIILGIAINLLKTLLPQILELTKQYLIDNLEVDKPNLSPEELKTKYCPTPTALDNLITKRNNIVDFLNNTVKRLDLTIVAANFAANFAEFLQTTVTNTKTTQTTANVTMSFIPTALPGAIPAAINVLGNLADQVAFKSDGTPRIPPFKLITSVIYPSTVAIQSVILQCIEILNKLDALIILCNPDLEGTLTPISQSAKDIAEKELIASETENENTYKGFILEIETKKYSNTVNQNRAVGKNLDGIILVSTEYSFASNTQVLIDELKFIIDRDNLKAY